MEAENARAYDLDEAWAHALRQQRYEALMQQNNLAAWEIWDAAEPATVEAERAEEAARVDAVQADEAARVEAERAEEARMQAARAYHIHQLALHARLAAGGRQLSESRGKGS